MSNNLSWNFGEDAAGASHDGLVALTDETLAAVSGGGKAGASSKDKSTYLTFTFQQVFVDGVS